MIYSPVHPRLRGELALAASRAATALGSSPLTRGTQTEQNARLTVRRFIPAYAGNSVSPTYPPRLYTVHPRLRGELATQDHMVQIEDGSSPLTRGTLQFHDQHEPSRTVHPRLRGELNFLIRL